MRTQLLHPLHVSVLSNYSALLSMAMLTERWAQAHELCAAIVKCYRAV